MAEAEILSETSASLKSLLQGLDVLEPLRELIKCPLFPFFFLICHWHYCHKQIKLAEIFNDIKPTLQPEVQPEVHVSLQEMFDLTEIRKTYSIKKLVIL